MTTTTAADAAVTKVASVFAIIAAGVLTLTRDREEGAEQFEARDLETFRAYLAANGIERVRFDFYGRWPVNPVAVEKIERHANKLFYMLPIWEREDETQAAEKLLREKARLSGERAREALPQIEATEPRKEAAVTVEHPRAPRLYSYMKVTGERAEVYAYVAHVFATDSCTQCYEHMLYRLIQLDELEGGQVTALLSKSLYAGD